MRFAFVLLVALSALSACGTERLVPAPAEVNDAPAIRPSTGKRCEVPSGACRQTHLNVETAECFETDSEDGTPCTTACVRGSCVRGQCLGTELVCTASNACLVPYCDAASGCGEVPKTCGPVEPCKASGCDPILGCQARDVTDGTSCGIDDCRTSTINVCRSGQCVAIERAAHNECSGRWIPASVYGYGSAAVAYDKGRETLVFFGGADFDETWERDRSGWHQRLPARSPPGRGSHVMAYDPVRRVIVLHGGSRLYPSQPLHDTWEWDGQTWAERPSMHWPSSYQAVAAVHDGNLQSVVVLSADGTLSRWTGTDWAPVAVAPGSRVNGSLAWDPDRQRVILFGGSTSHTLDSALGDTWTWDGARWEELLSTSAQRPSPRSGAALAYDTARRALVVMGGWGPGNDRRIWELQGNSWSPSSETQTTDAAYPTAFDSLRRVVVQVQWKHTREWNGTSWSSPDNAQPDFLADSALAADVARNRVVLLSSSTGETWEWDGAHWEKRPTPLAPRLRRRAAMTCDSIRRRCVLFGGLEPGTHALLLDTWEWDGQSWREFFSALRPHSAGVGMIFDEARRRSLLVEEDRTWEWAGTAWNLVTAGTPVGREVFLAYDRDLDAVRSIVWPDPFQQNTRSYLLNGSRWEEESATFPSLDFNVEAELDRTSGKMVFVTSGSGILPGKTLLWKPGAWTESGQSPRELANTRLIWDPASQRVTALSQARVSHFAR